MGNVTATAAPDVFDEDQFPWIVLEFTTTSIFGILLCSIFIVGVRNLAGFGANYALTLMIFDNSSTISYYLFNIIGLLSAYFEIDWENQLYWRFIGVPMLANTVPSTVSGFLINAHICCFLAYPHLSSRRWTSLVTKITFLVLILSAIIPMVAMFTPFLGARFVPFLLTPALIASLPLSHSFAGALNFLQTYTLWIPIITYIFIIVYCAKKRRFAVDRMTMQCLTLSFLQLIEYIIMDFVLVIETTAEEVIIITRFNLWNGIINLIPFLAFNRSIQKELLKVCSQRKRNTSVLIVAPSRNSSMIRNGMNR